MGTPSASLYSLPIDHFQTDRCESDSPYRAAQPQAKARVSRAAWCVQQHLPKQDRKIEFASTGILQRKAQTFASWVLKNEGRQIA
jgi:hypothetical protein